MPLDVHESPPLDHPWCTVRRVALPAVAGRVLARGCCTCPSSSPSGRPRPCSAPTATGQNGNANPEVQKRCLNLARLGYVTFSSTQNHYEDLYVGVSHQTLMIWNNIRALDYLESLPEVDKTRIGVAGASGGGLQTEMLMALDPRVKAATHRRPDLRFPPDHVPRRAATASCNHFPNVMRRTDHPEISTLGLPAAVQYLTMNDWTRTFEPDNFPTIQQLYAANGCGRPRRSAKYFNTDHNYDKHETRVDVLVDGAWVRGKAGRARRPSRRRRRFPADARELSAAVPADKGFAEISRLYRAAPRLHEGGAGQRERQAYRKRMCGSLRELLGEDTALPRRTAPMAGEVCTAGNVLMQRVAFPSEARLVVPATVFVPPATSGKLPVIVVLDAIGREALAAQTGPGAV